MSSQEMMKEGDEDVYYPFIEALFEAVKEMDPDDELEELVAKELRNNNNDDNDYGPK